MPGTWTFQPKPPGQVKRDPFEDVFFIGEEEDEPGDPCPPPRLRFDRRAIRGTNGLRVNLFEATS